MPHTSTNLTGQFALGTPSLPSESGITGEESHWHSHDVGSGDLNSCPIACTANILTSEPSPHSPCLLTTIADTLWV